MPNDSWIGSFQRKVRELAERTVSTLDSPWAMKSSETLNDLASYVGMLGKGDGHLEALGLISSHLGTDSDYWEPGSQQASLLAGAGFGSDGIASNVLLGELIAKGVEDLHDHTQGDRQRSEAAIAQAKAEAVKAVEEETAQLIEDRDRARGELDAEKARNVELQRDLDHLKGVLNATTRVAPGRVRRTGDGKQTAKRPKAARPAAAAAAKGSDS